MGLDVRWQDRDRRLSVRLADGSRMPAARWLCASKCPARLRPARFTSPAVPCHCACKRALARRLDRANFDDPPGPCAGLGLQPDGDLRLATSQRLGHLIFAVEELGRMILQGVRPESRCLRRGRRTRVAVPRFRGTCTRARRAHRDGPGARSSQIRSRPRPASGAPQRTLRRPRLRRICGAVRSRRSTRSPYRLCGARHPCDARGRPPGRPCVSPIRRAYRLTNTRCSADRTSCRAGSA